ncbi:MAG: septum formation initiator family protein [Muribaculaceae bacterium]|jgi:cell division protein FtsB|nr:septum formation initiator family protein [Bacteroidales bacterium]MBQ1485727.1 septum formation initiator family protein [Muribaculaceae bacterium]MBQ1583975.1 septum formation initiator family protein [Muribaculaceae bacterium]MBR0494501.1 septum formation initiator family protein [Muribaculaceae bacterium]MBR3727775.1 septum formation initiator family protein [Muribaculaceae bacterium]
MSPFKFQRPKWIPRWLNIPLLIFVAFVVVLLFFGDNNYMRISKYRSQINELKSQIKNNEDSAAMYDAKVNELNTDNETLERLVREKYGMKRTNEEVYITDIP